MSVERIIRKNGETVWQVRWRESGRNRSRVIGHKRDAEAFDDALRADRRSGAADALNAARAALARTVHPALCVPFQAERVEEAEMLSPHRGVYFVRAARGGPIKIGHGDVPRRVAALQTASAEPLTVVAVIVGAGPTEEARLHEHFARERLRGEWFRASPRLLRLVAEASPQVHLQDLR